MKHLQLPFAGERSLGYQWQCSACGEDLRSERTAQTNWQTWYFTRDGRRHYKTRCNLKGEKSVTEEPEPKQ